MAHPQPPTQLRGDEADVFAANHQRLVSFIHLPPDWGPFSQPYADIGVDAISWADLALTILVGLSIGFAARPRPLATRTEHP